LSAFQALKSTRPRILKLPEKATPTRRRRRRQLQLGDVVDEGQHGQPKKRTYSRVGSWRAFVSYHSRSSSRRAQTKWDPERLQELSEAYRALSEEELGFFRDLAVMMSAEPGEATPKRCRYTASQLRLRAAAAERIAICDAPAHTLATVAPPWQSNSIWETAELQRKLARDAVREALILENVEAASVPASDSPKLGCKGPAFNPESTSKGATKRNKYLQRASGQIEGKPFEVPLVAPSKVRKDELRMNCP